MSKKDEEKKDDNSVKLSNGHVIYFRTEEEMTGEDFAKFLNLKVFDLSGQIGDIGNLLTNGFPVLVKEYEVAGVKYKAHSGYIKQISPKVAQELLGHLGGRIPIFLGQQTTQN